MDAEGRISFGMFPLEKYVGECVFDVLQKVSVVVSGSKASLVSCKALSLYLPSVIAHIIYIQKKDMGHGLKGHCYWDWKIIQWKSKLDYSKYQKLTPLSKRSHAVHMHTLMVGLS